MAVTAHVFPTFLSALQSESVKIGTDTVNVLLIQSSGANSLGGSQTDNVLTAATETMATKAQIMANGSDALTEVAGTGYTTGGIALTPGDFAVSNALSGTTNYTSITYSGTIQWTGASFTAYQAVFIDMTADSGAGQGICWWDFGAAQTATNGTFTLTLGTGTGSVANCLVQFSNS